MADGVQIPVVIDIDKAFEEAAKKVGANMHQIQNAVNRNNINLFPHIDKSIKELDVAKERIREIVSELQLSLHPKDASFFSEITRPLEAVIESLTKAQIALNQPSTFDRYITELSRANIELLQMRSYYEDLEDYSMRMSDSINGYRARMSDLNEQWNRLTAAQREGAEGDELYNKYKQEAQVLKEQVFTLDQKLQKEAQATAAAKKEVEERIAAEKRAVNEINSLRKKGIQSRRYENAILNSTVKSVRVLQEQERILSERLNRATIGSQKYESLKTQLQGVRQEIQRINNEISGGLNPALEHTGSRLAMLIKNSLRLLAIHTASRFVRNIREVTSEFELQKVALGSIIQDTERASSLFRQIKAAAIESPFEIKDLVSYTKQLSAYRIETDKLFGVTQKLADVSAGLGVDMSRLILAYGQVRAASVLRGQELRQFTEAGVPLVELLAEKFTKLNGRMVSTAEVFDLISKRAVPFQMIEEIFDDMTSAGGMFYKMQEKQAETLLGQWNNLKDAVSIMYDEIGRTEAVHKAMTTLIKDARDIMLNWRQWAKVIKVVGTGMLSYIAITKSVVLWDRLLAAAEAAAVKGVTVRDLAIKRLTAALFGQRAASAIARRGMALYAAATLNAATTTNVLKAALWNLVAAMASNPFTIAALGAAALVGVFTSLAKKTKTVEERITDASKAINSMERNRSNEELIAQYETLANKTNRSAKETAALRDASRELGKVFPLATKAVDNQTGALILDIDKLKEYAKTAKETTQGLMEDLITTNNVQIKALEKKQSHIEKVLERGYGFVEGSYYYGLSKDAKNRNVLRMKLLEAADGARQLTQQNQELQDSIDGVVKKGNNDKEPYPPIIDGDKIQTLRNQISEITSAYKKFSELTRYMSKDEALKNINKLFPSLEGWEPTFDNMVATLEGMLADYKGNADATRILEQAIANIKFDKLKTDIEQKLARLSDEIKRSEAARNFYHNILDLTGDEKLAATMSVEVYGGLGNTFQERMQQQLNAVLGSLDASKITDELRDAFANQNFAVILQNLDKIPEAWHKQLKDMADSAQKFSADQIQTWLKELQKDQEFADKRVQLARQTQERIAEINRSNLPDDEKQSLISQYVARESKEVAKLQYEAFKNSPMYIALFEDLDAASSRMLDNMRTRLIELKSQWSNLDPVQLKEMQKRLDDIDAAIARRNPFKALGESIKAYRKLLASGRTREGDEEAALLAEQSRRTAEDNLETAVKDLRIKKDAYEQSVKQNGADSITTGLLKMQYDAQNNIVNARRKEANAAKKGADTAQENADEWTRLSANVQKSIEGLATFSQGAQLVKKNISDIVDLIAEMSGSEGLSEAADLLWNMAEAASNAASGFARVLAGDISGAGDLLSAKMSGVQIILQAINMINNIQLREWDTQMESQNKILTRLQRTYDDLGDAIDDAFGNDYIYNYNEMLKNLAAQQEAYEKQMVIQQRKAREASKEEDRKAAAEEADNLAQQIEDTKKQAKGLTESLQEFFAGTSVTSAAEAFADAWLDAYREFGSTTDAIKAKMEDMINNLVVKSVMAGAVERILGPWFDKIEEYAKDKTLASRVPELATELLGLTGDINETLGAWANTLQSQGINLRQTAGRFTGIAHEVAGASEESILALAAGINTQNFYMSYVPTISTDVHLIAEMLSGGSAQPTATAATASAAGTEMLSVQELANRHLPHIDQTLNLIYGLLNNVIKANGTSAAHYVATRM